jgi:hypothetical protein
VTAFHSRSVQARDSATVHRPRSLRTTPPSRTVSCDAVTGDRADHPKNHASVGSVIDSALNTAGLLGAITGLSRARGYQIGACTLGFAAVFLSVPAS